MFEQEDLVSLRDDQCRELIEKFLTICLPVKITPCVEVKPVKAEPCGKPIITSKHGNCCKGNENGCCEFIIIQKMKVEIPLDFKALTDIADPFVDCENHKDEDDSKCLNNDKDKFKEHNFKD